MDIIIEGQWAHCQMCVVPTLYLIYPLVDIIGIKPAPGDHKSNLKEVGAIPCGCNSKCLYLRDILKPRENKIVCPQGSVSWQFYELPSNDWIISKICHQIILKKTGTYS